MHNNKFEMKTLYFFYCSVIINPYVSAHKHKKQAINNFG